MMAVMASRVVRPQRRNKVRLRPNLYDGYAIYCDQDRSKIINLLIVLNSLGLRIRCKDNNVCGERMFEATIDKGILVSKCCLLFVSTNFKCDPFCKYFTRIALLQYVVTDRKYRIITICLDHTKIPCLGIFKEISITNFTCGTKPEIILNERLLCIIYKAIKGPRQKSLHNIWTRFHYMSPSFGKKTKSKLLKTTKTSKFSRIKLPFALKRCAPTKIINLGYLICKCFFNSFLWRKFTKLITCQQVLSIIPHLLAWDIKHLRQLRNAGFTSCNFEVQLPEAKSSVCRYCRVAVFSSELDEHENECCKPDNCGFCGMLIPRAKKQKHENECIFDMCSICDNFHSPSHECSKSNSQTIGICEDLDSSSQDNFSSLSSQITSESTVDLNVTKSVDKLLEVVGRSFSTKKNKKEKDLDNQELIGLVHQLLEQMKYHKIIECTIETIYKTMDNNHVPIVYSSKSLTYFRNFVYAVELHCDNISLFKERPLVNEVMCGSSPQPKKSFFSRLKCKRPPENEPEQKANYLAITKDLFRI